MVCRYNDISARLYDIRTDPQQTRDLAEDDPETVEKMFEVYALKDAGGSLPPN
jgi:hypothetical protein